jgi:hypothetical protein
MATIKLAAIAAAVISLAACTLTSDPMETTDGSYVITGTADAFGTTSMAVDAAQSQAQKFCAKQGKRAVAVAANHQDGPQGGFVFANRSSLTGVASAMRYDADLQFRCI